MDARNIQDYIQWRRGCPGCTSSVLSFHGGTLKSESTAIGRRSAVEVVHVTFSSFLLKRRSFMGEFAPCSTCPQEVCLSTNTRIFRNRRRKIWFSSRVASASFLPSYSSRMRSTSLSRDARMTKELKIVLNLPDTKCLLYLFYLSASCFPNNKFCMQHM